jgi:hypothetical protein
MPDITMCTNQDCPLQDTCWRLNCPPARENQAYQRFEGSEDENENFLCDFFIPFPDWDEKTTGSLNITNHDFLFDSVIK